MQRLSSYAKNLSAEAKLRCQEKISAIFVSIHLFVLLKNEQNASQKQFDWVDGSDLVSFLVVQTNFLTTKQFKAHESLEAHNQFA